MRARLTRLSLAQHLGVGGALADNMARIRLYTVIYSLICLVELAFLLKDQLIIELAPLPFVLVSALHTFTSPSLRFVSTSRALEILSWGFGLIVFYCITVLFGAPVLDIATLIFAATMTALVWVPSSLDLAILNGRPTASVTPLELYFKDLAPRALVWSGMAAMLGAYLGTAAVPLDWDRWWQRWPLPCLIGALGGFPLGHLVALVTDFLLTH